MLQRTQFGPALADAVGSALLIVSRQSQARFIVPAMLAGGNELIGKLVARFESALPDAPSVAALATQFCMSDGTLSRHVRAAIGAQHLGAAAGRPARQGAPDAQVDGCDAAAIPAGVAGISDG